MRYLLAVLMLVAGAAEAVTETKPLMLYPVLKGSSLYIQPMRQDCCATCWCCSTCGEPVKREWAELAGYDCGATRFVHDGAMLLNVCDDWPIAETTRPATAEEIREAKENKLPAWTVTSAFLMAVKIDGKWVMRGTIQRPRIEKYNHLGLCPHGHVSGRVTP